MQSYLVTVGAGFIGSHLVEALLKQGRRVRVLDNLSTGRLANIEHLLSDIEFVQGDIRSLATVRRAVAGIDIILHQAALVSVPRSVADPLASNESNVTGTLNLLVAARDACVKRVVFASSSSIYGNSPTLPKVESMPADPLSPYAISKLAGERYCLAFAGVYGLPAIALRYFNVYGPRQDPASEYAAVIPKFIAKLMGGEPPTIYGDGSQSRDFTYVADVVAANLLAAAAPSDISGFFNVACGARTSLLDLVAQLNRILGTDLRSMHEPSRAGDVQHSQADITKIRTTLSFTPSVTFRQGLEQTVAFFREIAVRESVQGLTLREKVIAK
jgi:UDP-glucose 4-epimerase